MPDGGPERLKPPLGAASLLLLRMVDELFILSARLWENSRLNLSHHALTARHAACLLRGKRRAGLRRWQPDTPGNAPAATAIKRPSPPAQCPRRLRSALSPPFPPVLRHGALRPKKMGPRACGSGRAAPCRARTPPDASQPARWRRWAWVPFVAACAVALAGPAFAQPAAPPHGAGLSRPRVSAASFGVRCRLPSQVRWSAIQHNARNYAQRKKRTVRLAPA